MDENTVIETLKKLGGKLWEKYGKRRIYFDSGLVLDYAGLKLERYNTGNICRAWLDGKEISNSAARRIVEAYSDLKIFYDLADGEFKIAGTGIGYSDYAGLALRVRDYLLSAITEQAK